jgi:hypothetical protein
VGTAWFITLPETALVRRNAITLAPARILGKIIIIKRLLLTCYLLLFWLLLGFSAPFPWLE